MRFLLVDRLEVTDEGTRGFKLAALSEDYFEWHFPERPVVPGMLVLESAVQTAGWQIAAQSNFENWFLLDRVNSAKYYTYALPGHTIGITLETQPCDDAPARLGFRAACDVNGKRSAALEFEGTVVPLDGLMDPEAARAAYERLCADVTS